MDSISLLDLVDREKLDEILEKLTIATGVSCIVTEVDGTPLTSPQNFTSLCSRYCRSTPEGIKKCYESDHYGGKTSAEKQKFVIYECFNAGLLDCASPIIVNGYHIASVLMGQVLDRKIDRDIAIQRARNIGIEDIDGYLEELEKVPVIGANKLTKIAGLMEVITRTISELALQNYIIQKRSRRYLERVVNSVSDCIVAADSQSNITMVNDSGAEMFGYRKDQLIGQSLKTLFRDCSQVSSFQQWSGDNLEGQCRLDVSVHGADDKVIPVQLAASNIVNDEGVEGVVAVLRDVSEERKMEKMKEDLVGMLTHDMGNPILSVQSVLKVMVDKQMGDLNDIQYETLQLAFATCNQLHGIVTDFLDIYRSENGKFLLRKQQVAVETLLAKSIEMVELFAREKNVKIIRLFEGESSVINGDYTRLLRSFTNLLSNAINYSQGGQTILVSVKNVQAENAPSLRDVIGEFDDTINYCQIKIIDRGPGIPKRLHTRIFDKFFSIHGGNGPVKTRSGTGLGLAFCRLVAGAHGGGIWVKSPVLRGCKKRHQGSCFNVVLPLAS